MYDGWKSIGSTLNGHGLHWYGVDTVPLAVVLQYPSEDPEIEADPSRWPHPHFVTGLSALYIVMNA